MKKAAERLGLTIVPISVTAEAIDLEAAMKSALAAKVQAVMTAPMTTNLDITDRVAALATKYGLPFIHDVPQLASDGLAVYGPDFEDIFRRAGHYVARILKGASPAELPIELVRRPARRAVHRWSLRVAAASIRGPGTGVNASTFDWPEGA